MASFTETATLQVKDESSAQIKAINRALRTLMRTAASLKSASANIEIKTKGLAQADVMVRKLAQDVRGLRSARVNLSVNSTGVTQAARQLAQLRSAAARPINATTTAGGVGGLAARGTSTAAHYLVRELGDALKRGVKEGTVAVDLGQTSLDLKQLSKPRRALVEQQISEIGTTQAARPGGAMFNRGQIAQQYSEMLSVVKAGAAVNEEDFKTRAKQAQFMADQNLELAATMVKMGVNAKDASEESIKYGKALEIQGTIYDKNTGMLDPQKAAKQYDLIRSLIPTIGKEMTGENFLQMMKYLRASKFSLSDEATALAMGSFEEMGTSAAVGLNQMIKTVGGSAKKTALAEQARLGLIGTKEVTTGSVGKQKTKTIAGDLAEENAKLLRENPQQWVDTKLIPALKADAMKRGATKEEADKKLQDPAYVANTIAKIFSERTAQEMATSMVLRSQENQQFLADWRSRQVSLQSQREATKGSVIGTLTSMQNQLQGALGEGIKALAPALQPMVAGISESMQKAAQQISEGKVDPVTAIKGAMAAGGGLAAVGLTSGLQAMMSSDPGVRALGSAGTSLQVSSVALDGSAAALLGAAEALGVAAAASKIPGGLPGGAPGGSPGGGTPDKGVKIEKPSNVTVENRGARMADAEGRFGRMGGAQRGVGWAAVAALIGTAIYEANKNSTPESRAEGERVRQKGLEDLREEIHFMKTGERRTPEQRELAKALSNIADVTAKRDALQNRLDLSARTMGTEKPDPALAARTQPQIESLNRQIAALISKIPPPPPAYDKPPATFPEAGTAPIMQLPEALTKAGEPIRIASENFTAFGQTLPVASSSFASSAAMLPAAASQFSTVFGTGATMIGNSGQVAASFLTGAAPGIGASIGQAAAAAIQAAVSNINVNVNANVVGGGSDKGNINNANGNK